MCLPVVMKLFVRVPRSVVKVAVCVSCVSVSRLLRLSRACLVLSMTIELVVLVLKWSCVTLRVLLVCIIECLSVLVACSVV